MQSTVKEIISLQSKCQIWEEKKSLKSQKRLNLKLWMFRNEQVWALCFWCTVLTSRCSFYMSLAQTTPVIPALTSRQQTCTALQHSVSAMVWHRCMSPWITIFTSKGLEYLPCFSSSSHQSYLQASGRMTNELPSNWALAGPDAVSLPAQFQLPLLGFANSLIKQLRLTAW